MKVVLLFFTSAMVLASCAKDQNQIRGTWNIESVTFNGEQKKNDSSLLGIVKYEGSYDHYWQQTYDGSYGAMIAKNSSNDEVMRMYLHFDYNTDDTAYFGYDPTEPRFYGSYLPGMIDTLLTVEKWEIIKLTNNTFSIRFNYNGNMYQVDMKK